MQGSGVSFGQPSVEVSVILARLWLVPIPSVKRAPLDPAMTDPRHELMVQGFARGSAPDGVAGVCGFRIGHGVVFVAAMVVGRARKHGNGDVIGGGVELA